MKKSNSPAAFYFELLANGEETPFLEAEGVSTEVALQDIIKEGENPFKYRLPSIPKTGHLVLKYGRSKKGSKLMKWCAANQNKDAGSPVDRSKVALFLKDAKGRPLLEWTLFNAYPVQNHISTLRSRHNITEIEDLELAYSFFTLSKK